MLNFYFSVVRLCVAVVGGDESLLEFLGVIRVPYGRSGGTNVFRPLDFVELLDGVVCLSCGSRFL